MCDTHAQVTSYLLNTPALMVLHALTFLYFVVTTLVDSVVGEHLQVAVSHVDSNTVSQLEISQYHNFSAMALLFLVAVFEESMQC